MATRNAMVQPLQNDAAARPDPDGGGAIAAPRRGGLIRRYVRRPPAPRCPPPQCRRTACGREVVDAHAVQR
ncbi:MAG: hypothetical protein R2838_21980 [Caldilineaceae bacterium]